MAGVGGLQAQSNNSIGGSVKTTKNWWDYVLGYDYNAVEPYGGFAKPDLNFNAPGGSYINALLPGTVTAIDGRTTQGAGPVTSGLPAWGHVVTVRLSNPYVAGGTNAQSTAYLHLSSVNVKVGQQINGGDPIGYWSGAAPPGTQAADPGFAFGNGGNYGADAGSLWGYGYAPGKAPAAFNPDNFIKSISGKPITNIAQQVQTNTGTCGALDIPCQISSFFTKTLEPALVNFGEHIAVFVVALLLIIIGFYLLNQQAMNKVAGGIGDAVTTIAAPEVEAGKVATSAAKPKAPEAQPKP